jgi:hypothetical protein
MAASACQLVPDVFVSIPPSEKIFGEIAFPAG